MTIPPEESLIEYPSDFPIKVVGIKHEQFEDLIVEMIVQHDPTFHNGKLEKTPVVARQLPFIDGHGTCYQP